MGLRVACRATTDMSDLNHVDLERILLKPLTASKVRHTFRGKKSLLVLEHTDEIVYRDIGRVFEYKQFEKEWQHITHNEQELMRSATALSHHHQHQRHHHRHHQHYHAPPMPMPMPVAMAAPMAYPMTHPRHGHGQHSVYYNGSAAAVSGSHRRFKSDAFEEQQLQQQPLDSQGNQSYKSYNSSSMSQSLSSEVQ